jgi:hypothetical protein
VRPCLAQAYGTLEVVPIKVFGAVYFTVNMLLRCKIWDSPMLILLPQAGGLPTPGCLLEPLLPQPFLSHSLRSKISVGNSHFGMGLMIFFQIPFSQHVKGFLFIYYFSFCSRRLDAKGYLVLQKNCPSNDRVENLIIIIIIIL